MDNRRRFARWRIDRQVRVRLEDAPTYTKWIVQDISFKGLRAYVGLKLHLDTFLKLDLVLNDETILELEVWVVWHKSVGGRNLYGFYFSRIKDPDKERIYQFVRKFYPQQLSQQWWIGTEAKEKEDAIKEDRRIFQRFPVHYSLRFLEVESGKEGSAGTKDISARGIGFTSPHNMVRSTALEMWLKLPDQGEQFYTRGEVAWSKKTGEDEYQVGVNLERPDLMDVARVLRAG